MEKTPRGTAVGVDDPYEHAGLCDHLTDDGRCRYAFEYAEHDPAFARERRAAEFRCPVVADADGAIPDGEAWAACRHYRCRTDGEECLRCGLPEHRDGHTDARPLLEEHHLSYADGEGASHEITVTLCRWCHATVHDSWGRITDDVSPDPEALAEREGRRSREQSELSFEPASDRYDPGGDRPARGTDPGGDRQPDDPE